MILKHGLHLAYCTNVHRGEDWAETFDSLKQFTLQVKERVQPEGRYAIGLRLSDLASRELSEPSRLLEFQRWLDRYHCYVFTINGFPFGQFHDARVKEKVYLPDWTDPRRLAYTKRLFDLLAVLVPPDCEGSVSTSPGSFKEFISTPEQEKAIRDNMWRCVEHIAKTAERSGRRLHLGVEPEPFGWFEDSFETVRFFDQLRDEHPGDDRLAPHLGVNYDACHFAVEFEEPESVLARFQRHGIRLSKIHISNALKLRSNAAALKQLATFTENVYLHQVIIHRADESVARFRDLGPALDSERATSPGDEWRVHFHVPLQCEPTGALDTTADHVLGLLKHLGTEPQLCSHLEMETYTWAVLPEPFRSRDVIDQIVAEYDWTMRQLSANGLA